LVDTSTVVLVLAVFGASLVESVEALTIVLAAGTARQWRSALEGCAAAVALLVVLVAVVGVPLVHYVPINDLRVVVGALLLVMGMGWLRKAWLRASGLKALHDEDAIFAKTVADLQSHAPAHRARDPIAFAIAFKGTFLEGMEVVLIVISLGASAHKLALASVAAFAAIVVVVIAGMVLARQLSKVPENLIKMVVGVMLCSFGLFWVGEGAGLHWPGSDAALLVLIGVFAAFTVAAPLLLRVRERTS
jgi:Ca2+/H+ antiporter, TMEM165/GDT1 family